MLQKHWTFISRAGLVLLILLSGLALLPLTGLSAEKLTWELYAGLYEPSLVVVGDAIGSPGSAFEFAATGYQPNAEATIYVDGNERGTLMTDNQGSAQFLIQTEETDSTGQYVVTMATDANTSDSDNITLDENEPVIPPPPNFNDPIFTITAPDALIYMPAMFNQ